jgi:hypothetical protein
VRDNPRGGSAAFPHRLLRDLPTDSAASLVDSALRLEELAADGGRSARTGPISTTFVVRRGGMGEAEVRLTLHLSADPSSDSATAGVVLVLDAAIRDIKRMMVMSTEDARSPRMSRETHPVQDNDRETLQRIRRLEDRLRQLGWTRVQ